MPAGPASPDTFLSPMKKLDISAVPTQTGSNYPAPLDLPCNAQSSQRLARHAGLTAFGVNLTVIEPGATGMGRPIR
jgi:uncharacterized cupin superfamily protein